MFPCSPHPGEQLESALDTAVQQLYGVDGDLDRRSLSLSVSSSELPPSLPPATDRDRFGVGVGRGRSAVAMEEKGLARVGQNNSPRLSCCFDDGGDFAADYMMSNRTTSEPRNN